MLRHLVSLSALGALALTACTTGDPLGTLDSQIGNVTLSVTNNSCAAGACDSIVVLGFPAQQPLTPGGLWSLQIGVITGPSACFTLPKSAQFLIIGENSDGGRDTTAIRWNASQGLALGAQPVASNRLMAQPTTGQFVPTASVGWTFVTGTSSVSRAAGVCSAT